MTAVARGASLPRMKRLVVFIFASMLGPAALAAEPVVRPQQTAPSQAGEAQAGEAKEIDSLYSRLAKTQFPDEASGIVAEIDRLRLQSGSDVANLLIGRASKAREGENWPVALQLYDSIVELFPDWPEAWSQRGAARFQTGDLAGAISDLAQALKRDPRDLDALASLGAVLLESGDAQGAVTVYDRTLALAPAFEPLKQARERAKTKLWSLSP